MKAIENVHKLIMDIDDLSVVKPYLDVFVTFLDYLLSDKNVAILLTTLKIIGEVVKLNGYKSIFIIYYLDLYLNL